MKLGSTTVTGLCLVLVLASAGSAPVSGQSSRAEQIEELLELMGSGDLGVQVMQNMLVQLKPLVPQVPQEWWDEFSSRVDADDINQLVIPIYEKHFTEAEIKAMVEFYGSPTGRSIVGKLPLVTQESMAIGQAWGQSLFEEIIRDLEKDGYELPAGLKS